MYKKWASSLVPILFHTNFSPHSCKTKAGQEGLGTRDIITMMHVVKLIMGLLALQRVELAVFYRG